MNLEKQKAFIIHVVYFVIILLLVYIGIKYLLPLLMPFVIGMIIAIVLRRLIDTIEKKTRINRAAVSIIILILFYGLIGLIVMLIGFKAFDFLGDLFGRLPDIYRDSILPSLQNLKDDLIKQFPDIKNQLDNFTTNLDISTGSYIDKASTLALSEITSIAGQLPSLLIKFIFTIVSSFFFTIDYYRITHFITYQFKGERRDMLLKLKDSGIGTVGKFFRAYAIIISITFVELSVGLLIIGIPNPFLIGLLIAIIDILPILGTGAVIIPWSIISFIQGNTRVGIGMLILYLVITAVRQTIEPKIVGQQIGLHPIVTLLLMFVGAQLMGILGLFMLPIIATLLLKLNNEGTIHLFRKPPDKKPE